MFAKNFPLIRRKLLCWYDLNKRDLPWRRTRDPYAIWISETMLQQTQVKTVLPYYVKFLTAFPSVAALDRAPLENVLRAWSGLGYYRRAENLKKAARQLMLIHTGNLPRTYDQLRALAGIGDYTAGAILSIAFNQRYPAFDGNARRVLERNLLLADEKKLRAAAGAVVPLSRPGDFNQALMELGATICLPKQPLCDRCPLASVCAAKLRNHTFLRSKQKSQVKYKNVTWPIAIIRHHGKILLRRRADAGLLARLWELPGGELTRPDDEITQLRTELEAFPLKPIRPRRIGEVRHSITHRRIRAPIYLIEYPAAAKISLSNNLWRWTAPGAVRYQAVSALTTKAVKALEQYETSSL
jgi:A/G-specific adenine glycosylase